jgi:hypothetical protein
MAVFYSGDVSRACAGLMRLVRQHATKAKRSGVARFQMDRFVSIRVALATAAWVAGDRGEARTVLQDALVHSLTQGHLVSHSNCLAQAALPLALWAGETETARGYVTALSRNLALRDIAIWQPVRQFYEGAVASLDGDAKGVDTMRIAIEKLVTANFLVRVPFYLATLAEFALRYERIALARDSLSAAFDRAGRQGEAWSQPELLRVRGLLQRRDGDLDGASETLLLAMETARESGAHFFRLRATTSLAELLAQTERREAAADLLLPICDKLDDGSPCANIAKARHLLQTLRRENST